MLVRRLLLPRDLARVACRPKQTRHSSRAAVEPDITGPAFELRLPSNKPKQPTREPFVKNLVMGKFDREILTYPEVQTYDRNRQFLEWLAPIEAYMNEKIDLREIDQSGTIKDEIFEELKSLGVLRAAVSEDYDGLGLNSSEYAKLVETVSVVPALGNWLTKRAAIATLISQYGTEQQKYNLLPRIAKGEIRPSLCIAESMTGSLTEGIESTAELSDCETLYVINGRKLCVLDSFKANLYVVLVQHVASDPYVKARTLSAFVVPRDTPGVKVEPPLSVFGQRGIDVGGVSFENVKVPKDSRLGSNIVETDLYVSVLGNGKCYIGAQTVAILKRFLNLLTGSVIESKSFNVRREHEDSIHEIVGNTSASLYAVEAMTYLTTGMMDGYEKQDTIVEQSLVECYCTHVCREAILQAMTILGTKASLKNEPFEQIIRDALVLDAHERSAVETKIFAALMSVQHIGKSWTNKVRIARNPFFFPYEILRSSFSLQKHKNLHLEDYLHPSLRTASRSLEISVDALKKSVEIILVRHGIKLVEQRMDLRRLTDMMIEVYAMTAVIGRASRSYCIGMRNSDEDVSSALLFAYRTQERVKSLASELEDGNWSNGDAVLKQIANAIFDRKQYFASHPLERNF